MKRYFFLLSLCASLAGSAQNELQIVPATVSADGTFVLFNLENSETAGQVRTIEFTVAWPEGWTISNPNLIHPAVRERTSVYDEDFYVWTSLFEVKYGDNGDGTWHYAVNTAQGEPLKGGSGAFMIVKVTPQSGTPDGFYPVKLIGGKDAVNGSSYISTTFGEGNSEIWLGEQTSYLKVGSPKDATLAVTGLVPSFVTSALNSETAITTLDLTDATAINGEFALLDNRSLVLPEKEDVTVEKGTYTRSVPTGYSTLCLPFAYTCGNKNFEISAFGGLKNGKSLILNAAGTEVAANTPVIFKATSGGDLTLSTSESFKLNGANLLTVEKDGVSLIGTYARINAPKDSYVLQSQSGNEAFYKVGSTVPSVPANRCYLEGSIAGVKAIAFPDGATAIDALEVDASNGDIYDIAGRKVNKAEKGIYIVDGKKVVK